jgi:hypothetical protein
MKEAGWSAEDGAAAQRHVVDYMVKEFVDSSALNGGDKAYQEWTATSAPKYYADHVVKEPAFKTGEGNTVLGNYHGNAMPNLIHDGTPREKTLDMNLTGFMPYDDGAGTKGIEYTFKYTAEYRVSDKDAAAFAGKYTNMSGEAFLKSQMAKDSLKDGSGENVFVAKGTSDVVVAKDAKGAWKIIGFQSQTDYDTSNFTQNYTGK